MGDEALVDEVKTKADPAAVETKADAAAVKNTVDPKVVKNEADPKVDGALFGAEVPRRPL